MRKGRKCRGPPLLHPGRPTQSAPPTRTTPGHQLLMNGTGVSAIAGNAGIRADSAPGRRIDSTAVSRRRQRADRPGPFVVLVGPDGVGKTSVARALAEQFQGSTVYVHFRPPLRGPLPTEPPDDAQPPPKARDDGSRIVGWLRLLRSIVVFRLGYWMTIRRYQRAGALVIGDRWVYGYVAQPWALRYYGPEWLARLAVGAVPGPDMVANLTADPETIRRRKQDLSLDEITHELAAWSALRVARMQPFSTDVGPGRVAGAILDVVSG